MKRTTALARLRALAGQLKASGATALFLFGSTNRDEATPASDLDLFVDYQPGSGFSLLDLAGLKVLLEDELAVPVDITTRDSLHPLLRDQIIQDATRVF